MAARAITTDVPWVLCHDLELCSKINAAPSAPPGGFALCTINGFWMEQTAPFVDQPSPSWVAERLPESAGAYAEHGTLCTRARLTHGTDRLDERRRHARHGREVRG